MTRPILRAPHDFNNPGGIEECIPYHVVTTPHLVIPNLPDALPEECLHDYVIMFGRFPIDPTKIFDDRLTFLPCLN